MSSVEFKWVGDSLWEELPDSRIPNFGAKIAMKRKCVGNVAPTKRGTYWAVQFYMGNIRAAFPTKEEARDFLMLVARSNE